MYAAHDTQSPYVGISGYNEYNFPLPSLGGLGALSGTEIAIGAVALGAIWWFMRKHRR